MLRRAITKPIQAPTALQAAFVEAYLDGNNATQSALLAGCAPSWAPQAGSQYLKDPSVNFAIVKGAVKRLARRVPLAINVLDWLAQNAASEKVRLDAAKTILSLAGIVAPKAPNPTAPEPSLNEMSIEQLRAMVTRHEARVAIIEDEIVDRAKPIGDALKSDQAHDAVAPGLETAPIEDAEPAPNDNVDLIG